eukprot:scaffold2744_cov136-Cylindrotheca_fusiformis.AAC.10
MHVMATGMNFALPTSMAGRVANDVTGNDPQDPPPWLRIYDGEEHGVRQASSIEGALDTKLVFYGRGYRFDIPDAADIKIDRMQS